MLKLTLADKSEYEVIKQGTAVYPSYSTTIRNRMEIHMKENAMTLAQLEKLFTDNTKTSSITLAEYDTTTSPDPTIKWSTTYSKYDYVTSFGKETVTIPNVTDASQAPVTEVHLVVKLEQLTYIEQQLAANGITV